MRSLTLLTGVLFASLFATGIARPQVLDLDGERDVAAALPVATADLKSLRVTDRTGTARGQVVEVLRLPDDSVTALQISWTGPQAAPGMTIEHPVQFLDFRPETRRIVVHQSWSELQAGYSAALSAPDPAPPRAGSA